MNNQQPTNKQQQQQPQQKISSKLLAEMRNQNMTKRFGANR